MARPDFAPDFRTRHLLFSNLTSFSHMYNLDKGEMANTEGPYWIGLDLLAGIMH